MLSATKKKINNKNKYINWMSESHEMSTKCTDNNFHQNQKKMTNYILH